MRFVDKAHYPTHDPAFHGFDGRSRVACTAASLAIFLIGVRATTVGWDFSSLLEPFKHLPFIFVCSVYDVLLATLLGLAGLLTVWRLRRRPSAQRRATNLTSAVALLILLVGVLNVLAVHTVGAALNFRWLHYRALFRNADGRNAITAAIDFEAVLLSIISAAGLLAMAIGMRWLAHRLSTRMPGKMMAAATLPALAIYIIFGHWYLTTQGWPDAKTANPVVTLATSMLESIRAPRFLTMWTAATPDDVAAIADRQLADPPSTAPRAAGVRNVIFFVMSSVPADMLEYYGGGSYNVTPNLNKFRDRSIAFHDIYAPAPATHGSAIALLCSNYPWISSQPLPLVEPKMPIDSIAGRLRTTGNTRTALFASGDLNMMALAEFLPAHGFDFVQDYRTRKPIGTNKVGAMIFRSKEFQDVYGSDDVSTAASCVEWIEEGIKQRDERPFFATVWTLATHEPYFAPENGAIDYKVHDANFNRYLNAMHHGDEALGRILAALETHKLLDSTLVVVVADRGEPFAKHRNAGEAGRLYDEDLRVPLIMINGKLFHGENRQLVGSLVDVAPTVLDLLGSSQLPVTWQGRSLFSSNRANRAYFCSASANPRFGWRDGQRKLIYDVTENRTEVYDLANDPHELRNLATSQHDFVEMSYQHIAAWVQYQQRFYDGLFDPINVREPTVASHHSTQPTTQPTTQVADQR